MYLRRKIFSSKNKPSITRKSTSDDINHVSKLITDYEQRGSEAKELSDFKHTMTGLIPGGVAGGIISKKVLKGKNKKTAIAMGAALGAKTGSILGMRRAIEKERKILNEGKENIQNYLKSDPGTKRKLRESYIPRFSSSLDRKKE